MLLEVNVVRWIAALGDLVAIILVRLGAHIELVSVGRYMLYVCHIRHLLCVCRAVSRTFKITIKIDRSSPNINIVLESWELVNDRVQRQQVVTINKGENNHVYLGSQPLITSFDELFLRPPSIPKETNISLNGAILKTIAKNVWEEQGF
jgi:hypothetical protein